MLYILPEPKTVKTRVEAQTLLPELMRQPRVALDTETDGLNRWKCTIDCWSLSFEDPTEAHGYNRYALVPEAVFWLEDFLVSDVEKVFHNEPFDRCMFANSGIPSIGGTVIDTMALDAIVDENRFGNHGLKECAWDYLNLVMRSYKATFKGKPLKDIPFGEKADYASEDAWATLILLDKVLRPIAEEEVIGNKPDGTPYTLWDLYLDYIPRFNLTLYNMCRRGWKVDLDYLGQLAPSIQEHIAVLDRTFNQHAQETALNNGCLLEEFTWVRGKKHLKVKHVYPAGIINPGSADQLGHFFVEVLGLPVLKKTDGGKSGDRKMATDEEAMQRYASEYNCGFASIILERRSLQKTLGTYVNGLQKWADPNNKVHASLRAMGARTGRLSCADPNVQCWTL